MLINAGLLFLFLTCAKSGNVYNGVSDHTSGINSENTRLRPRIMHMYKREALIQQGENATDVKTPITKIDTNSQNPETQITNKSDAKNDIPIGAKENMPDGLSEGGIGKFNSQIQKDAPMSNDTKVQNPVPSANTTKDTKTNDTSPAQKITAPAPNTTVSFNSSDTKEAADNSPGVVKRGLIVFGGFTLLAVAYFIFYRKKNKNYDSSNTHNSNDTNQFRYGVLQSDDRRDNLELSRIPLTMESDEDEDDLEIFDLEQKKKSLSYVNLQANDEEIVLSNSKDESKNNLLLDIEDGPSDTLINWSSNGNKSIL